MTSKPPATSESRSEPSLARKLGTRDAVLIGLGSMIGAGVFSVWAPAATAAGNALLVGLAIAAAIAFLNAIASAQLAATFPTSGGTYIYGRECLGPWWGFTAGWGFVIGKTASCAAMALTFAAYAMPSSQWGQRIMAVAAVLALSAFNYRGITRTVTLTRIFVSITLIALIAVVIIILTSGETDRTHLDGWYSTGSSGIYGILQSAGLLFFAFAGYARIATMGEEVRDPGKTIPRAIPIAFYITLGLYLIVGTSTLLAVGSDRLADSTVPLVTAVESVGAASAAPLVRTGAIVASLGALLALIAGVGRTTLAMARNGDLPGWLAAVHPTYRVPHHAEVTLALVVCALVLTVDLRGAIGFSSFGVLVYYAIANAGAFTQTGQARRWPRWCNLVGLAGCTVLVLTLPWQSILAGFAVFAVGIGGRVLFRR